MAVALVSAAAALVATSDAVHAEVMRGIAAVGALIAREEALGVVAFAALAAISATFAFFSSAAIVPVGVYAWGPFPTTLLLWGGWILGGAAAYGIGRLLGRPVVAALTSAATLARFESLVARHGSRRTVLLLQLALPSEVPGYVLGLAHWGLLRYLGVLAVAELPYAAGTVLVGSAFLERRAVAVLALSGAALAVAAVAVAVTRRRASPHHGVGR